MAVALPVFSYFADNHWLMRIALGVEYSGENFNGWQRQPQGYSVQACVEDALAKVANHPVNVFCAGRTDSGVHALAQVIHTDVNIFRPAQAWVLGTNAYLPKAVKILWSQVVDASFHARFSAQTRHYRYLIFNRPIRSAIFANRMTWTHKPLDIKNMQAGANYLIGTHDFSAYRAVSCQAKNPVRTIIRLTISRWQEIVFIDISANAFLHHMVRNIAGVLMAIGCNEHPPVWAKTVLEAKDRTAGGVTAPANGLYFCDVDYPPQYALPKVQSAYLFGLNAG